MTGAEWLALAQKYIAELQEASTKVEWRRQGKAQVEVRDADSIIEACYQAVDAVEHVPDSQIDTLHNAMIRISALKGTIALSTEPTDADVTRVAEAIHSEECCDDTADQKQACGDHWHGEHWRAFVDAAHAAIVAMRRGTP
jgi:hypothetical protein